MPMKNPPHPGLSVKIDCLEPLGLSVTDAAKMLGVSRAALSRLVNAQAAVSPEMAIRFEKAGWSTADTPPSGPATIGTAWATIEAARRGWLN